MTQPCSQGMLGWRIPRAKREHWVAHDSRKEAHPETHLAQIQDLFDYISVNILASPCSYLEGGNLPIQTNQWLRFWGFFVFVFVL